MKDARNGGPYNFGCGITRKLSKFVFGVSSVTMRHDTGVSATSVGAMSSG